MSACDTCLVSDGDRPHERHHPDCPKYREPADLLAETKERAALRSGGVDSQTVRAYLKQMDQEKCSSCKGVGSWRPAGSETREVCPLCKGEGVQPPAARTIDPRDEALYNVLAALRETVPAPSPEWQSVQDALTEWWRTVEGAAR